MRPEAAIAVRHLDHHRRVLDLRTQHFAPMLFRDPSWFILLEVAISDLQRRPLFKSGATVMSRGPQTTGLRHVEALIAAGLIEAIDDPSDRRKRALHLSPVGRVKLETYLAAVEELGARALTLAISRCHDAETRLARIAQIADAERSA